MIILCRGRKKSVVQLFQTSLSFIGQNKTLSINHCSLENHWLFYKAVSLSHFANLSLFHSLLANLISFYNVRSISCVSGPSVATRLWAAAKSGSARTRKGIQVIQMGISAYVSKNSSSQSLF